MHKVNILIAEDDKDDFQLLKEAIENVLPKFNITHSRDGREFTKHINEGLEPDIIFLDLNMPFKSGVECLKEFRQELYDYLFVVITKNNWDIEWACEKELNRLLEISSDRLSHIDCAKEEMRRFAKTNLLHLLVYMQLDARRRGLYYLDASSISNALSNFSSLWPFTGSDVNAAKELPLYMKSSELTWYQ